MEEIAEHTSSLSSKEMFNCSIKHNVEPAELREQINLKHLMREKEALVPYDDAKVSRDHGRHFLVTRQLGNDLVNPGTQEWQIMQSSA